MILVTGTGRSGTHYTAVVMQKLGLDIPHEAVGRGWCLLLEAHCLRHIRGEEKAGSPHQ